MKFTAVGDALIVRRIPEYEGFSQVADWIKGADARFFNLETTLHREGECYGFSLNGGSYLRSDPEVLEDCKKYGFNMTSFCNNHAMDYAFDGMLKTLDHLTASGLVHTGVGKNLDQAAAPAYLDLPEGRVALISMTSSCNSWYNDVGIAGRQSRRIPGRPGVNQLRINETLIVTKEQMAQLQEIARQTTINAQDDISRKEGYKDAVEEGQLKMGKHVTFRVGEYPHRETLCNPKDLERLRKAIEDAKFQADFIMVSVHSHEIGGTSKEEPSQFLQECAHFAIDQGADAVVGHGPHLLRPVEIYKGKPIFYSLGDFILHNENTPYSAEEFYEGQGMTSDATMYQVFAKRSKNFTRGLQTDKKMFEAVIPRWEMKDGKLVKLELLPIELGFGKPRSRNGLPAPAPDDSILQRLAQMSEPYGTKMEIANGIATVILE